MNQATPTAVSPTPDFSRTFRGKLLRKTGLWEFAYNVRTFFYQLLRVDFIRLVVAAVRYYWFAGVLRRFRTWDPGTGSIGVNTVHHNKKAFNKLKYLAVTRSNFLLYPLSVIRISKASPVLCIGPRAEGELLNLMGLGFHNVRGLDLMSYSPWIDIGDMHAMPYADNRFGVVVMGWCIAYSNERLKAAAEAVRVTRNGGIIAVGVQYMKATAEELSKRVGYQMCDEERLESVPAILALFGSHVDRVYFSQDVPHPDCDKCELLVIFSVKK